MGKTPIPLKILVSEDYRLHPEVLDLEAKGHEIYIVDMEADLILHPAAHQWTPDMWDTKNLEMALKAARERKRGE